MKKYIYFCLLICFCMILSKTSFAEHYKIVQCFDNIKVNIPSYYIIQDREKNQITFVDNVYFNSYIIITEMPSKYHKEGLKNLANEQAKEYDIVTQTGRILDNFEEPNIYVIEGQRKINGKYIASYTYVIKLSVKNRIFVVWTLSPQDSVTDIFSNRTKYDEIVKSIR